MLTVNCEQGTDEWFAARCGVVTASCFSEIFTSQGKPTSGAKRPSYMNKLIAESLMGHPAATFQSDAMRRGTELEPEARDFYAFNRDCDPVQVGLVYLDNRKVISCSPDALIDDSGLWECKCPLPHTHVDYLLKNKVPAQYVPQVQGQLWVTDREWCDFHSYHPELDSMIIRVNRDDTYIKALASEVEKFVDQMLEKREQLTKRNAAA